jgi:hypothetical protein
VNLDALVENRQENQISGISLYFLWLTNAL